MNSELERERRDLAKSEIDLAEGQQRIDRQVALIAQMRTRGFDASEGERLLELLRDTLAGWQLHHGLIVDRIAYLERRLA